MEVRPPPGIGPVPPAMPPELSPEPATRRSGFPKLGCGIALVVAAALVAVSWPVIHKQRKMADMTKAIGNAKQIHLALHNFDADFGRFPDATTIPRVREATKTTLALGTTTSNDHFRQMIATVSKMESIFWAKTPATPRKPNEILGADALGKGECSYSYVAGLSSTSNSATPIIMTPMIPGTNQFDPAAFEGKAVVLRIDGSAKAEVIRTDDHKAAVPGGTLFDPSSPIWNGKPPDLKWPE